MSVRVQLTECPRDAMQGIKEFIPTDRKVEYLNQLLKVGFDYLDFGSFVSPKAIPQMADTHDVVGRLQLDDTDTRLLAIVANRRGAEEAAAYEQISILGYPFSISETFQVRNTNSTIEQSLHRVEEIAAICQKTAKELVIYISMGFGNPYGDPYSPEIVLEWVNKLKPFGARVFQLSDTVGVADPQTISYLFSSLIPAEPDLEFGAHLHTAPHNWSSKVRPAYENGCRRFDSAIYGFGGCPMAKDELIGNMPTENLVNFFTEDQLPEAFSLDAFADSLRKAREVFPPEFFDNFWREQSDDLKLP